MDINQTKRVLEGFKKRRDQVIEKRRALEGELITLNKTIEGLEALCAPGVEEISESPASLAETLVIAEQWIKHMPFADAVRTALKVSPSPMTPPEVRELLERAGFPIHERTDPLVSIHVCLKRLVDSDEAEVVDHEGRKAYRWIWEHTPPKTLEREAIIRTMNRYGSGIAGIYPDAADRQLAGKDSLDAPPSKPKRK